MSEPDNVIDLTAARLRRQAEDSESAVNQDLSWALLNLYQQGAIKVEWRDGEMFYSLKPGYEEGLYEAREGPSFEGY